MALTVMPQELTCTQKTQSISGPPGPVAAHWQLGAASYWGGVMGTWGRRLLALQDCSAQCRTTFPSPSTEMGIVKTKGQGGLPVVLHRFPARLPSAKPLLSLSCLNLHWQNTPSVHKPPLARLAATAATQKEKQHVLKAARQWFLHSFEEL